ncbi:MAG: hypothetical protein LBQ18_02480 [Campylobacteraceae bacterium]|jgi:hypothetical protein|nr:hypothetical protein [Campylobacteraceae bacterium]
MKKVLWALSCLVFFIFAGCADKADTFTDIVLEGTPVYHIEGFKDKRIRAVYNAIFKSTANFDSDDCGSYSVNTGLRRAALIERTYLAADGNYELNIPIVLHNNQSKCGYQFVGLELDLRRISGEDVDFYYSRFMLLWDKPENDLITYRGYKSNQAGDRDIVEMPPTFITNKKYFRVAPDTSFLCRTTWREWSNDTEDKSGFHCVMKIGSGDTKFYPKNEIGTTVTNPQFGVDEILSSNLTINIIADDNGSIAYYDNRTGRWADKFREYVPHKKSTLQKLFD